MILERKNIHTRYTHTYQAKLIKDSGKIEDSRKENSELLKTVLSTLKEQSLTISQIGQAQNGTVIGKAI